MLNRLLFMLGILLSGVCHSAEIRAAAGGDRFDPGCALDNYVVPENLKVYAAGGYKGEPLDFQIDESNQRTGLYKVEVYSRDNPVALLLGSYEPAIWEISWSPGTVISSVIVTGYYAQAVAGLDNNVPVLNSVRENGAPCSVFYMRNGSHEILNPLSQHLFDRPVELVIPMDDEFKFTIGDPASTRARMRTFKSTSVESFRDRSSQLTGTTGIEAAIAKRIIRPATAVDAQRWVRELIRQGKAPDLPRVRGQERNIERPPTDNAFVVMKEFEIPLGSNSNQASYFVLEGVPLPLRRDRYSTVYVFDSMLCTGPRC